MFQRSVTDLARRISTPRHHTTPHIYVVFDLPDATLAFDARKSHICAVSEKLSGVGHEIHRPIRNTLILGLVQCIT